jgi:hypothetical protein
MSLCSDGKSVPTVTSDVEQHNGVKSGHTLRVEFQDMLNSHGMKISHFANVNQADSEVTIEKHSSLQASHVVSGLNHVLGSKVDGVEGWVSATRTTKP